LLEDAAHAHGAMFKGRMAGALGDAGCFSFYPTKVMTSGLGGMLTTEDSGLAEAARLMRTHGQNAQGQMTLLGNEWRLSEISAIVGRHQLERLEFFIKRRNEIAECYSSALRNVSGISLFQTPPYIRHSYYKFALKLSGDMDREKLAALLWGEYGVETGHLYYPPCHLQPFYIEHFGTREGDLPVAESVLRRVLCLPMHAAMSDADAFYVAESLKALCNALK
ncbi:MAG: DegT/DnrJ/EryC1/StrS family aminotransferase, partial [Candidatus Bathyarchaeia archaeon]